MMNKNNDPSLSPKSGSRTPWRWPRVLLGAVVCLWAVLITYLFIAPPQWAISSLSWLRPAGHFRLLMPYLGLLTGGSWNWMVSTQTWADINIGLIGLAAMLLVGWLFTSCFETYIPRSAEAALWFVMGIGLCGTVYTVIALAGLLYQWLSILIMVLLVAVLFAVAQRKKRLHLHEIYPPAPDKKVGRRYASQLQQALDSERKSWMRPQGILGKVAARIMLALIVLITALTFFHALFFPETYWDSLILYLGYARGIFLEHRFPIKVVGQVGVGLGANYPHLYELTGAVIATWANWWSFLYLQLAAPLAGLFTIILVYHIALRLTRSVLIALAVALMVRSLPYLITYHIYATNYSFAVLFSVAFFYCALRYVEDGLPGYMILAALCAAFSTQINYLMWVLWICWCVMVFIAHVPRRYSIPVKLPRPYLPDKLTEENTPPDFAHTQGWSNLGTAVRSRLLLWTIFWCSAISSIWYVRNWIVTGNPVYAFFTGIFRGSKHVNPEVMASAVKEWQAHGDGIGVAGPGLLNRIGFTWPFFVNNFSTSWKWAPVFMGIVVPGILIFLVLFFWQWLVRRPLPGIERRRIAMDVPARFAFVAFVFFAVLFLYHYMLGPFYLYHLLPATAVFGVFVCFVFLKITGTFRGALFVWAILCGLMPGLPWAMMGAKLASEANTRSLVALHNPGMDPLLFYQLRYGQEPRMWMYINRNAKGKAILTHENRQALFDPSIRLVHMDDWEVQQVWDAPRDEKLRTLYKLGVQYYLKIPYEFDHPINARLGHEKWIKDGRLQKVYEAGDAVLYRFSYPYSVMKGKD